MIMKLSLHHLTFSKYYGTTTISNTDTFGALIMRPCSIDDRVIKSQLKVAKEGKY